MARYEIQGFDPTYYVWAHGAGPDPVKIGILRIECCISLKLNNHPPRYKEDLANRINFPW